MLKDKDTFSARETAVFIASTDKNCNRDIQNQTKPAEKLAIEAASLCPPKYEPPDPEKDVNSSTPEPKRNFKWRFGGVLLAVFAAILFSLVNVCVKLLPHYHAFSTSFWRQFGNVIPSIPLLLYFRCWKKQPIFDLVWPINWETWTNIHGLALRGSLGSACVLLRFYSLDFITIADSSTIMYGGPIFTIVLAHFFLKEQCGIVPILIGFWSLFGVFVLTQPPFLTGADFDNDLLIGTGISLVIVFFQAIVTLLMRKVRKIHFAVMTFFFGFWGVVQNGIVAASFGVLSLPVGVRDIGLVVALSLCSFLGQMCCILALKFEEAGNVSLVRTSDVIFAFIFQALLLDVESDIFSVIGACIVLSAVLIVAFRKWLSLQSDKSNARRYFEFLLK